MPDLTDLLREGIRQHDARNFNAAEGLYRAVLEQAPAQADALYLMGCLARAAGKPMHALMFMEVALALRPAVREDYARFRTGTDPVFGTPAEEMQRLRAAAARRIAAGEPVKLQFGAGSKAKADFFNLDINCAAALLDSGWFAEHADEFFLVSATGPLPLPDASVDFVFHEDFIEHLPQRDQFVLLAECRRVLKPGAVHRVSTPSLAHSMRTSSRFERGAAGVYTGEWDSWGHLSLFTHASLAEAATMIGYRQVVFTDKNASNSPHRCEETRPSGDRPDPEANIFADLIR